VPKKVNRAGLPDGLFSNQKSQFGQILDGLRMKNVRIFYEHSEQFTAVWYILRSFGTVCVHLVYFSHFGMFGTRKIWQPWNRVDCRSQCYELFWAIFTQ
jgi:hypothetical protein